MRYNTFVERSRAKWALQAKAPLPKPGRVEYTPEMIAWQAEYNAFMEENFGGRVDMMLVPFIEMPEYKEPLTKLETALENLSCMQPKAEFDCIFGYTYEDPEAGEAWESKMGVLREEIQHLKDEADLRTYGEASTSDRKIRIGDDVWSYDEYLAMVF